MRFIFGVKSSTYTDKVIAYCEDYVDAILLAKHVNEYELKSGVHTVQEFITHELLIEGDDSNVD